MRVAQILAGLLLRPSFCFVRVVAVLSGRVDLLLALVDHPTLFALGFVIFDVEVIFLYPWAVNHATMPVYTLLKAALFIGILLFGLAYAWRKRALEWR